MRKVTLLVVSVATLVGVFALLALAGPSLKSGPFSRPAEAANAVKVTVGCYGNPERTRVENNTNHRIKIRKVGSLYQPRSNEPFRVHVRLRAHRGITFESGTAANSHVLTHQYIYNNDAGRKEGARVKTSVGRFVDHC